MVTLSMCSVIFLIKVSRYIYFDFKYECHYNDIGCIGWLNGRSKR